MSLFAKPQREKKKRRKELISEQIKYGHQA
jgi:hypothetical protein